MGRCFLWPRGLSVWRQRIRIEKGGTPSVCDKKSEELIDSKRVAWRPPPPPRITSMLCLGFHGRRSRRGSRCGRLVAVVELHLRSLARSFVGLEVGVVAREAAHASDDAIRKKRDKRVVILHGLVVTPPLDGDTVFRALQVILCAQT